MHPIKAKRIRRIVAAIRGQYPSVAHELEKLVTGATNPPHAKPARPVRADLQGAMHEVLKQVVDTGAPIALAGGMAVIHWVDLRSSLDLDFVMTAGSLDAVRKLFPGGRTLDLIYTVKIDDVDVDFLLPRDVTPWADEAIREAAKETVMGVPNVPVLRPEYLILYKFDAAREKDMDDIKGLLTLPGVKKSARKLVMKYMPQEIEDFDSLALEAEYGV